MSPMTTPANLAHEKELLNKTIPKTSVKSGVSEFNIPATELLISV